MESQAVDVNPLVRFLVLRVQEKALRVPTLEEFRRLVDAVDPPEISRWLRPWERRHYASRRSSG